MVLEVEELFKTALDMRKPKALDHTHSYLSVTCAPSPDWDGSQKRAEGRVKI